MGSETVNSIRRPREAVVEAPTLSTVEKAIEVLQEVVASHQSVGVTEIARRLKINPSTVYRILSTYRVYGFVEQDDANRYRASIGLIRLLGPLMARFDPRRLARPVMERLVEKTKESVNLMVPDRDRGVYVDSVQGSQTIRMVVEIGKSEFLHCSAVGKAILAYFSDEERERIITGGLVQFTPKTITDPEILRAHLKLVRNKGYAVDDEEGEEGTRCVGAPIRGSDGRVVAGISVSGPAFRLTMQRLEELAPLVKEAADEITELMGYHRRA